MLENTITHEQAVAFAADEQQHLAKLRKRAEIKTAGDTDSILGTTADCAQLLLLHFSKLIVALESANSLADVRAAALPFKSLATQFVNDVDAGEVVITSSIKTEQTVMADIGVRATHVSRVLAP